MVSVKVNGIFVKIEQSSASPKAGFHIPKHINRKNIKQHQGSSDDDFFQKDIICKIAC
jgi:hypothetical protein